MMVFLSMLMCVAESTSGQAVECGEWPLDTTPQGVHTAYVGNASVSMVVSFFTCGAGGTPSVILNSSVQNQVVTGETSVYLSRHHHDIVLKNLFPGNKFYAAQMKSYHCVKLV